MDVLNYPQLEEIKERGTRQFPVGFYILDHKSIGSILHYHWHWEWQWIYIVRGSAMITIDGCKYRLNQHESVFINSGQLHSAMTENPTGCLSLSIVFNPHKLYDVSPQAHKLCSELYQGRRTPQTVYRNELEGEARVNDVLGHICDLLQSPSEANDVIIHALLHIVLAYLRRYDLCTHISSEVMTDESEAIKQVLQYIHAHYNEKVQLSQIAAYSGMSVSNLCRIFKTSTGSTIVDYLNTYRIYEACILLRGSKQNVNDIARLCGFDTPSYFIKVFKRQRGITPAEYRNQNQMNASANVVYT